jgi:hypothetical protein
MHLIKFMYVHINDMNSLYNIEFYVFVKPCFNNLLKFYAIILLFFQSLCLISALSLRSTVYGWTSFAIMIAL